MEFKAFKKVFQENFAKVTKDATHLFEVELDKDEMWNLYLDSFPEGTNEKYRERREYDCSCCRQFIRAIGNVVVIKNNKVETIWDFDSNSTTFQPVVNALSAHVKSKMVSNIWVNKFKKIGTNNNFEHLEGGKIVEWNHFYLELEDKFVDKSSKSEGDIKGSFRDIRNVFKRSLDEISEESVLTVLELISQNSLHRGKEWEVVLGRFLEYKKEYAKLKTVKAKENFAWEQSVVAGAVVGKIRNHSMGTLLTSLSEGEDLDTSVRKYEAIVGDGYKRPTPVYTKRMLEEGTSKLREGGYLESLARRYATLNDITVNNVLFSNRDASKKMEGAVDVFEEMARDVATNPKKFSRVEEVSIDDFINNILPIAKELELYLENKHSKNMVSLIAPENKDSKTMFKWDNGFGWAYSGNLTDSTMKQNVKSAGGNVDGVLRFSIQWNSGGARDKNDLDAHCIEPNGYEIYFGNKMRKSPTGGMLDVDIQLPNEGTPAVENITWENTSKMKNGVYKFFVHNYAHRGGRNGFSAEIEMDGQVYTFEHDKEVRNGQNVQVAEVTFNSETGFTIKEKLPSSVSSREVWSLKTNQFVPVSIAMFSPNYWDEQDGIGHRHYFFMLKDCVNPETPNGFYNEFLKEDLMKHKHVLEALGGKLAVKDSTEQLSGLGFSSTKRNEVTVKVIGQTERIIKIKF